MFAYLVPGILGGWSDSGMTGAASGFDLQNNLFVKIKHCHKLISDHFALSTFKIKIWNKLIPGGCTWFAGDCTSSYCCSGAWK